MENDTENAEVFKTFLTSVFTTKTGHWESQAPEITGKIWVKEDLTLGGGGPSKGALKETGPM